jgi:hypothetical protein
VLTAVTHYYPNGGNRFATLWRELAGAPLAPARRDHGPAIMVEPVPAPAGTSWIHSRPATAAPQLPRAELRDLHAPSHIAGPHGRRSDSALACVFAAASLFLLDRAR